jgi:hypothetical protein
MTTNEEVKKKRGRKKKSEMIPIAQENDTAPVVEKPKSRRGRKTKAVLNSYTVENGANSLSDDEHIIVRLNIKTNETASNAHDHDHDNHHDLSIAPNAYDALNSFESTPLYINDMNFTSLNQNGTRETDGDLEGYKSSVNDCKDLRVVELLKDFEMKSKMCEWPQSTSIACYWCCHQFNTVPFGIPVKYCNEKFHVFGCFCSLECAAAYNFDSLESTDEVWERYNLLNLLSRRLGYKPLVKAAPNKLALKMFGGHLDIETFRQNFESKKILSINFPPMMTITQQIEEVNECDISSEYRFIPLDNDRINRYKEKLTLKRSKPLTNYKHTLDHMMNLKIS